MAHPHHQGKPTFFWQGVLILLPVALMAAFSLWAILRERNAVEQEARQRAREILQALPGDFGRNVANRFLQFNGLQNDWYQYLQKGVAPWPESKARKLWLADTNNAQIFSNNLAALHSVFPDRQSGPVPLIFFILDTNGDLLSGRPTQPCPPIWLTTMSAAQYQAWTALQTASYSPGSSHDPGELTRAFQKTQPAPAALACAEFIQLRATLPAMSVMAVDQLLRFAEGHYDDISESGVPLTTLALAEALKRAEDCGPSERLWEALKVETYSPSPLTPILLDQAARLVNKDAQLSEAVNAMRVLFADHQAQADLAEAVRQTVTRKGVWTNLWVDAMGQRWFCTLHPGYEIRATNLVLSTRFTGAECYPKSLVAHGFADALNEAKISIPEYFGIALELEHEPIPVPAPWSKLGDGKPAGDLLAEAPFQMSQRTGMVTNPGSGQSQKDVSFQDIVTTNPQFLMQIRLTDRKLLYAKQRQLQFIFGALIAASALAALIGFVTARGAFRRQQQLSEMKSNFVSSVSHELRAPIASVRLMAENLEHGKVPEPAGQNAYFHFIVQECQRLSSLIENILDFSRIEEGRKQYEFEPVDLTALTRQTVRLMEPRAADRRVRLEPVLTEKIVSVDADGKALQQALVNLVDNAIKHSPKGAAVRIGLVSDADSLRLWVEDRGEGIPPEEHAKIFERFYRRGSELRRETQGVGIGLSIVKHIVEAHGGRIHLHSAVGQGSRFTIELAAKTAEGAA
jgi:signal transduction histidine kinase